MTVSRYPQSESQRRTLPPIGLPSPHPPPPAVTAVMPSRVGAACLAGPTARAGADS